MVDRHDYVALEWVKGEIAFTLKQARTALDTYAQQPAADTLEQCLACIHQVHGSLLMVEFYGAALLAEEMEQLVIALQQGRVGRQFHAGRAGERGQGPFQRSGGHRVLAFCLRRVDRLGVGGRGQGGSSQRGGAVKAEQHGFTERRNGGIDYGGGNCGHVASPMSKI